MGKTKHIDIRNFICNGIIHMAFRAVLMALMTWLCLFLSIIDGASQQVGGTFYYSPAKILKHTQKSTFTIPDYSYQGQLGVSKYSSGQKGWEKYWKNPVIGLHAMYINFGDKNVLGAAYGLFPSIRFTLYKSETFHVGFQAGAGMAYIDQIYDKLTNPLNNAISSHWNNITQAALMSEYRLYRNLWLIGGIQFTHCSNARTSTPNLGINTAGLLMGLGLNLNRENTASYGSADTIKLRRRVGGDFLLGYGISEYSFAGGPKYGVYFVNAGISYALSPYLRIFGGGEYEYSQSVFQFFYLDFEDKQVARSKATKTALYTAADLNFGLTSLRIQVGYYLPYPAIRESISPIYFKINLNVYPFPSSWSVRPYAGVLLKSHGAVAQHVGLVTGVSF